MSEKPASWLDQFKTKPRPGSNVVPLVKPEPKSKPKAGFKPKWIQVPMPWVEALQQSSRASTYRLAIMILAEAFKQRRIGGEVVLTAKTTGMTHSTRLRAVNELVKLDLIKVRREGKLAIRVVDIWNQEKE